MTVVSFVLTLYTPLRVGSTYARDGVDAAIDHEDPLPADHLKGVMRDAAARLLGRDHPCVQMVFGTPKTPSPWAWTSAVADGGWTIGRRHRVAIDADTHTAVKDMLVLAEHAWATAPRFEVHRIGPLPDPSVHDETDHLTVLRASAAGVHGLGSWRRRGLGWVGIAPDDGPVTAQDVERLLAWRKAGR